MIEVGLFCGTDDVETDTENSDEMVYYKWVNNCL
jgi:hypothetical protein